MHALLQCLERGADLEVEDSFGRTALIWAAIRTQPATLSALLHFGANTSARMLASDGSDGGGPTALDMALEWGGRVGRETSDMDAATSVAAATSSSSSAASSSAAAACACAATEARHAHANAHGQ